MEQMLDAVVHDDRVTVCAPEREPGFAAYVTRLARNWWSRRKLARLEELDNHLLKDIGLTRGDVVRVRSLPLECDPNAALSAIIVRSRSVSI